MENIFEIEIWTDREWKIYFNNLELLRSSAGLSKKDFNARLGIQNVYRRDMNKPGPATILTLGKEFDVDENWLSTAQTSVPTVEEKSNGYDLHGGWKPRLVGEDYEYAGKALEILASKTTYSIALRANINAFYNALAAEKNQDELLEKIKNLENRIDELEDKKNENF